MYGGWDECKMPPIAVQLLKIAHKYNVTQLLADTIAYLQMHISDENICQVLQVEQLFG
jgi:hypothetical protein